MKIRLGTTLAALLLAFVMIVVPSMLPRARSMPLTSPADLTVKTVTDLKGLAKRRRDEQLAELARKEYKIGPTTVVAMDNKRAKSASVWDRLSSAFAEDYSDGDTYASLTALDDGNPDTYEFYGYGYDRNYGGEAWGVVHGYFADEGNNVWVDNGGGYAKCAEPSLDRLLGFVSPAVHARPPYECRGGYDWGYGLRSSVYSGFASGFYGLLNPPCWAGGWGTAGGCFAANFVSGFATNLGYTLFDYSWWCNVMS